MKDGQSCGLRLVITVVLLHLFEIPSVLGLAGSNLGWTMLGGNVLRTNRLVRPDPVTEEAGWHVAIPTKSSTDGDYSSIGLDLDVSPDGRNGTGGRVVSIIYQSVVAVSMQSGSLEFDVQSFNPRGPVALDKVGNTFISWTGSAKSAGFRSYSPSGEERFSAFSPPSENYNYDVGPIAAVLDAQNVGQVVAGSYLWDSTWQSRLYQFAAEPETKAPEWNVRLCSFELPPLVIEHSALGHTGPVVIAGSCASRQRLQAVDPADGSMVRSFATRYGQDRQLATAATASAWQGRSDAAVSSDALLLFALSGSGDLCVYALRPGDDADSPVTAAGCNTVHLPSSRGGVTGQITEGRVALDPSSGTVFVQGYNPPLTGNPLIPEHWWITAVQVDVKFNPDGVDVSFTSRWNHTDTANSESLPLLDHSKNMQWALGELGAVGKSRSVLFVPISTASRIVAIDALGGPTGSKGHTFSATVEFSPRSVATDTYGHLYVAGVGSRAKHLQRWNRTSALEVFRPLH